MHIAEDEQLGVQIQYVVHRLHHLWILRQRQRYLSPSEGLLRQFIKHQVYNRFVRLLSLITILPVSLILPIPICW